MRMISRFGLFLFLLNIFSVSGAHKGKCQCHCDVYGGPGQNVCQLLENLDRISFTNSRKLLEWQELKPFVEHFSNKWKEEIENVVEAKINEYIASRNLLPKPEALVSRLEDEMQNDSSMIPNSSKDGEDVVSNLLAKVEKVENKTLDMEEEMKSERRVRRHLEDEVNKTQSSLIYLSDQLQNVTVPVDAKMNQVESVLISTLDNMNKTTEIYEDHLKKLYYKVEGVVYKNETRELDERLEHVETELLGSDNSSVVTKLEEGFKTLEKGMHFLNSSVEGIVPRVEAMNNLTGDVLIPRLETLESDTVRKNETDDLKIKITNLLKGTEIMRVELDEVSSGILDIQNLKLKFENLSEQWDASLRMLQNEIEFLKNESLLRPPPVKQNDETVSGNEIFQQNDYDTEGIEIPKSENYEDFEGVSSLLTNVSQLPDDEDLASQVDYPTEVEEISSEENGTNTTEVSTASYEEYLTLEPEDLQNANSSTIVELDASAVLEETTLTTEVTVTVESGEIIEDFEEESSDCEKPDIEDDHLLVDVLRDSYGKSHLKFGCYPIGLYKVSYPPVPPRCVGGLWKGPFPTCTKLAEMSAVDDENLETFIPPIHIEPNNIDRPSSHLGTGSTGQLIVHPRSSFTLHCLYPESTRGYPHWNVTDASGETRINLNTFKGKSRVSVKVTAATEEDSGIYTCVTPFEEEHAIEVIVKVVVCPAFNLAEEFEDVYYRPTPESEMRIMGTRAEFQCEEGHRIFRQCLANGTWSDNGLPSEKRCKLKKRQSGSMWNCKAIDVSMHPDLIAERIEAEKKIVFKCAGGKSLIGYSYTRCKENGLWSQSSLPSCK